MFFHQPKKYVTVTLYDPTRSLVGFTNNNRLPVTIEKGNTVSEVLSQFNKFRSPENQITTNEMLNLKIQQNMEIVVT